MYEYAELIKTQNGWMIIKTESDIKEIEGYPFITDVLNYITKYGWNLVSVLNMENVTYILKRNKLSLGRIFTIK